MNYTPRPIFHQAATAHATATVFQGGGTNAFNTPTYTQLVPAGRIVLPGHHLTTFARVSKFSAGTDIHGKADVYATWLGGALRRDVGTAASWTNVAAAHTFKSYSAVDLGQLWLISSAGFLAYYNNTGPRVTHDGLGARFVSISGVPTAGEFTQSVFGVTTDGIIAQYFVDPNVSFATFAQFTDPGVARQ